MRTSEGFSAIVPVTRPGRTRGKYVTRENAENIALLLRAGIVWGLALQKCGVPRKVAQRALRRAERSDADDETRDFADIINQARVDVAGGLVQNISAKSRQDWRGDAYLLDRLEGEYSTPSLKITVEEELEDSEVVEELCDAVLSLPGDHPERLRVYQELCSEYAEVAG